MSTGEAANDTESHHGVRALVDGRISAFQEFAMTRWRSPEQAIEVLEQAMELIANLTTEREELYRQLGFDKPSGGTMGK